MLTSADKVGGWGQKGQKRADVILEWSLKDSKLILNASKLFPWSSRISLVPFRTFRGSLLPKPVTWQVQNIQICVETPSGISSSSEMIGITFQASSVQRFLHG